MRRVSFLENASRPLDIPTYDGSGQCVHPDVISVAGAFFGSALLMVVEPYPEARSEFENPSLLCSDDGKTWSVPPGVANPLVSPPPSGKGWYSDADALHHDGKLCVYYRFNSGRGETTLFCKETADGRAWSERRLFTVGESRRFASPALVRAEDGVRMFFVDAVDRSIRVMMARDALGWGEPRTLLRFPAVWHADACTSDGETFVLLNDGRCLFLLKSQDLLAWEALDEREWRPWPCDGQEVLPLPLLAPSAEGWDNALIYRSTFLITGDSLQLWYGGKSHDNEWRVGYTDGRLPR